MTPEQFQRIRALFQELRDVPAHEWEARLEASCANDPEVRREVLAMLGDTVTQESTSTPWGEFPTEFADDYAQPEIPGFVILRRIGRGGMGEVFEAEQMEPLRRLVAIKCINANSRLTRGDEIIVRFEQERQILAALAHPYIVPVLQAGYSNDQRPYLVMPLIKGVHLTQCTDATRMSIRQRLELFVEVCVGVSHAHQAGVVHRDLKPGNILVQTLDGRHWPMLIDFGVAKAVELSRRVSTKPGQVLGTPGYLSPEQLSKASHLVDARADVYALGVILYELLTGTLPGSRRLLLNAQQREEWMRSIRIPPPSERLMELVDLGNIEQLDRIATARGTSFHLLQSQISDHLDRLTMRCLKSDASERFSSAAELTRALKDYLARESDRKLDRFTAQGAESAVLPPQDLPTPTRRMPLIWRLWPLLYLFAIVLLSKLISTC